MSKTRTFALSMAVAAIALSAGIAAQAGDFGKRGPREPVKVADMTIKAQERAAAMDGNGDGFVTGEEMVAYRDQQRVDRANRRLARLDTNKDGKVSVAEISDERTAKLAKLDANSDGVIDATEFRAMRHHRGHGGHRGGRHDGAGDTQ